MTKPTIKSSSYSLSQVTRPKAEFLIHKNLHSTTTDKLSEVSKISGSSPLHIQAMVYAHYIKNPQDLFNLAKAALTKIEQAPHETNSVLKNLEDNMNIPLEISLNSEQTIPGQDAINNSILTE